MKSQRSKVAVGAFVLGGIGLFVIGLILLTTRRFFTEDTEYILYFDASVNGLSIGAPVVFRGVPMGNVTRIHLVADAQERGVTIPVFISLNSRSIMRSDGSSGVSEDFEQQVIRNMVDRGLRARLHLQSLLTGKYAIELDFYPETIARYRSMNPEFEIPTIPSTIDAFQRVLSKVPLEHLMQTLDNSLVKLNQILSDGQLEKGLAAFAGTFIEAEKLFKNQELQKAITNAISHLDESMLVIHERLPASVSSFREAMRSMTEAATQVRQMANSVEDLAKRDSPTLVDFRRLLQEGAAAARALRGLADMLDRNPESLLQGRKGVR